MIPKKKKKTNLNLFLGTASTKVGNIIKKYNDMEEKDKSLINNDEHNKTKTKELFMVFIDFICEKFNENKGNKNNIDIIVKSLNQTNHKEDLSSEDLKFVLKLKEKDKEKLIFDKILKIENNNNILHSIKDIYKEINNILKTENDKIENSKQEIYVINSRCFFDEDSLTTEEKNDILSKEKSIEECKFFIEEFKKNMNNLPMFIKKFSNLNSIDFGEFKDNPENFIEALGLLMQIEINLDNKKIDESLKLVKNLFQENIKNVLISNSFKSFLNFYNENHLLIDLIDNIENEKLTLDLLENTFLNTIRTGVLKNRDGFFNAVYFKNIETDRNTKQDFVFGKRKLTEDEINGFFKFTDQEIELLNLEEDETTKKYDLMENFFNKPCDKLKEEDYYNFINKNILNIKRNNHLELILGILNKKTLANNNFKKIENIEDLEDFYYIKYMEESENKQIEKKRKDYKTNHNSSDEQVQEKYPLKNTVISSKNSLESIINNHRKQQISNKFIDDFRIKDFKMDQKYYVENNGKMNVCFGGNSFLEEICYHGQGQEKINNQNDLLKVFNSKNNNIEKEISLFFNPKKEEKEEGLKKQQLNKIKRLFFINDIQNGMQNLKKIPDRIFFKKYNNDKFDFSIYGENDEELFTLKNQSNNIFKPGAAAAA